MGHPKIARAIRSEEPRVISTLVTAFTTDPFIRWLFPEPEQYLAYFPQVLKFFAGGAFNHESAYRTDDFAAAALWLPPGISPDEESLGKVIEEGVAPTLLEEAFAVLEQVGMSHPEEEHWYLPAMGVDPMVQGKGYGTALIEQGLEECDSCHIAAYLESTNSQNVSLYQRAGYEIVGEIQYGSSPILTTMFRAAR